MDMLECSLLHAAFFSPCLFFFFFFFKTGLKWEHQMALDPKEFQRIIMIT